MYLQVQILDLTEVEIVEDPNLQKEPDVIDITNLDENEQNSAKQDKLDVNEKMCFFSQETQEKYSR